MIIISKINKKYNNSKKMIIIGKISNKCNKINNKCNGNKIIIGKIYNKFIYFKN